MITFYVYLKALIIFTSVLKYYICIFCNAFTLPFKSLWLVRFFEMLTKLYLFDQQYSNIVK